MIATLHASFRVVDAHARTHARTRLDLALYYLPTTNPTVGTPGDAKPPRVADSRVKVNNNFQERSET
jgi:hypothetical protein